MAKSTGNANVCFVKKEVTRGTLITPIGTDLLALIDDASLFQLRNTAQSLERVNSYSLLDVLPLRYGAGSFTMSFYGKRTGTADTTIAAIDTILENAMGRKTTNAGVSIQYDPYRLTDPLLNFSTFYGVGGVVLQAAGCFINDLSIPFTAAPEEASILRFVAGGSFYRLYWAGQTVTTAGTVSSFTVAPADLTPNDGTATAAATVAGKFTIGCYVQVAGTDALAHQITAINPTSGVCTVSPNFTPAAGVGAVVSGYLPTPTNSGNVVSGHKGFLVHDGNNFGSILAGNIHGVIPRRPLIEEKNGTDYAVDDVLDGKREWTVEGIRSYFDPVGTPKQDLFFSLGNQLTKKAITVDFGVTTGGIYQFSLPYSITREPKLVGAGIVELQMIQGMVASTALDDEIRILSK